MVPSGLRLMVLSRINSLNWFSFIRLIAAPVPPVSGPRQQQAAEGEEHPVNEQGVEKFHGLNCCPYLALPFRAGLQTAVWPRIIINISNPVRSCMHWHFLWFNTRDVSFINDYVVLVRVYTHKHLPPLASDCESLECGFVAGFMNTSSGCISSPFNGVEGSNSVDGLVLKVFLQNVLPVCFSWW